MAGLDPATPIGTLLRRLPSGTRPARMRGEDGRVEPGHDGEG